MRTSIVLNDDLMRQAMRYTATRSKRELIEEALRTFVAVKSAERQRERYREGVGQLAPKLRSLRLRDSPADTLREDRDRG